MAGSIDETGKLKILVVGNGGREHALVWKLSKSPKVECIYVAPGNGGTATTEKVKNVNIGVTDFAKLVHFAMENDVNFVVPGPEVPLVAGIESHFRKVGIDCFGPSQKAARMEGSKAFSKDFMIRHNIPTARFQSFTSFKEAVNHLETISYNVVLKADGLAAGKGVIIPSSKEEAKQALHEMMVEKVFDDAGNKVVIEEYLEGDEISVLAFSDGYTIVPLPPAQDHKRIFDGDTGPNTGGMGCYAPAPVATPEILREIQKTVLQPTIHGMRKDGFPFVGCLFTGFMLTKDGPKVLEYNVRFGDPETQTIIPLLEDDTDLAEIMQACVERRLDAVKIGVKPGYCVTVVAAAGGYPGTYAKNFFITLSESPKDTIIFHAGTTVGPTGHLLTAGGRVIAATALAKDLKSAVCLAYEGMESIKFAQMHFRKDIAHRAFRQSQIQGSKRLTYEGAGVSIDAGNELVRQIKPLVKATQRSGADGEIGGFGGLFDLKAAGYRDPVLVAGIDGIGTKIKIAQAMQKFDMIGIDLVAMNVNDVLVQGAEPLFFLDYYACGKLNVPDAVAFVKGVADGCLQAGCALLGGETAEMPSLYTGGDFDGAGAAVGAVERSNMIPRTDIVAGDILLGLASSGCHSNGFSLIRKTVELSRLSYDDIAPWDSRTTVGASLLNPTKIYCKPFLAAHKRGFIKAASHITGGGFVENIPRMLPPSLSAVVDGSSWNVPAVFKWLARAGNIDVSELSKTFNMGIGMVLVISPKDLDEVTSLLRTFGEDVIEIGRLVTRGDGMAGCIIENGDGWVH